MASSPPLRSAAAARADDGAPSAVAVSLPSSLAQPPLPTRPVRRRYHSILTSYQPTSWTDTMAESKGSGVAPAALAGTVAQGGKAMMRRLLTERHHRHGR